MPHANYETPEVILQYFAPNADGSPPDANDLEIQYGAKNLHLAAVTLSDLRANKDKISLTDHGVQLINYETAMAYEDFKDSEKIKSQYYPEVAEAIKKMYIYSYHPISYESSELMRSTVLEPQKSSASTTTSAAKLLQSSTLPSTK
jgi:hypothetical protein